MLILQCSRTAVTLSTLITKEALEGELEKRRHPSRLPTSARAFLNTVLTITVAVQKHM